MVLAFSLQLIAVYAVDNFALLNLKRGLLIYSYLLLTIAASQNLHLRGLGIIFLGLLLNFTVMVANGGFMPVSSEALNQAGWGERLATVEPGTLLPGSKDILLSRKDTNLWFISDVVALPAINKVISPGDILICLGLLVFLIEPVKQGGKRLRVVLVTASKAKFSRPKRT